MGKRLLIFGLFVSIAAIACVGAPDNAESDSSSSDARPGGGSLRIDSFKATSAGKTGSTASKFSTTDTAKNSSPSPSLNKKKQ